MRKLLIFFSALQSLLCSCPTGFDLINAGQCSTYLGAINTFYDEAFKTASSKCNEVQAQPLAIRNQDQQSYWTEKVQQYASLGETLIGIVCNKTTKRWEWADGSAIDYKPLENYQNDLDRGCSTPFPWIITDSGNWNHHGTPHDSWTINVFCTTQLHQPAHSSDGCETFEDDSDDGVCYQIGATAENWQDAQKTCLNFGANLASIHNQRENSFIRRLAVSRGALNGLYLGGISSGKGTDFGWIDGTPWDFTNFYSGFPVAGLGDCIVMDTASGTSGEWVNMDCNSSWSVACTRQQKDYVCPPGPWTEGQIIVSPGFPFEASVPCDYMLSVPAGKRVELEIIFLEANSCCDNLILYENYIGEAVLANLTGEISDKVYKTKTSNFMRVSWKPNGGVNVKGMMVTFRAV